MSECGSSLVVLLMAVIDTTLTGKEEQCNSGEWPKSKDDTCTLGAYLESDSFNSVVIGINLPCSFCTMPRCG